jgi:dolichol-phosphate mannosyltransferase
MKAFDEFSLIIFFYNEELTISDVVKKSLITLDQIASKQELVIINDGSTDSSAEKLKQFESCKNVKIVTHTTNLGIGQALKSGYDNATNKFVCAIPGDGQFDLDELHSIKEFQKNRFYSFYRKDKYNNFYRMTLTNFNKMFNVYFLNIVMCDVNWVKVYRLESLKQAKIMLNSSLIESEICAKLNKMNITPIEIPSKYLERRHGYSKGGNLKTLSKAVLEILKLYCIVKRFNYQLKNTNE